MGGVTLLLKIRPENADNQPETDRDNTGTQTAVTRHKQNNVFRKCEAMSIITTNVVERSFSAAAEKYETEAAILRTAIVNIAASPECTGCLKEYTPATLAKALTDAMGEFDEDDVSKAVTEAKNVIRNAVFHRCFRETFKVISPFSQSETGKIVEAFEKNVSEYTMQAGPKNKKTVNLRSKIAQTVKCEVADVDQFGVKLRSAIDTHLNLRNAREAREATDMSDYNCF